MSISGPPWVVELSAGGIPRWSADATALLKPDGSVQALTLGDVITVGTGGEYSTLEAAAAAAQARTRDIDHWARILIMPNSTLTLSAEAELPEYCSLVGVDRRTSIVVGSGNSNIRYRKWNRFENFTTRYSGTGAYSAGFRDSTSIGAGAKDASTVDFSGCDIYVTANQRPAIYSRAAEMVRVDGCNIHTSGMGLEITSGFHVHIRNTEIYLTNVDTGYPHYGIRHTSGRVTLWGCKISTGYGPLGAGVNGIVGESNQDIVGIYSAASAGSTRVDIFGLWSIIRNEDGADPGKKCVCLWNNSNYNVTRVWSAYLQVENGDDSSDGDNYEILNTGTPTADKGLIQISPAVRARRVGGPVHQTGPAIGMPPTITSSTTMAIGRGGLYRVDASAGAVTLTLPDPGTYFTPNITHAERYTVKRMAGANTITIAAAGSGVTIDGAASITVGAAVYSTREVVWCADSNMWLVV